MPTYEDYQTDSSCSYCESTPIQINSLCYSIKKRAILKRVFIYNKLMVARSRIELPTQGFSGLCSTTELPRHRDVRAVSYEKQSVSQNFFRECCMMGYVQLISLIGIRTQPIMNFENQNRCSINFFTKMCKIRFSYIIANIYFSYEHTCFFHLNVFAHLHWCRPLCCEKGARISGLCFSGKKSSSPYRYGYSFCNLVWFRNRFVNVFNFSERWTFGDCF